MFSSSLINGTSSAINDAEEHLARGRGQGRSSTRVQRAGRSAGNSRGSHH